MPEKTNWHVVPRIISGAYFYCVERDNGYIAYYCNTKERADEHIARLTKENIRYVP